MLHTSSLRNLVFSFLEELNRKQLVKEDTNLYYDLHFFRLYTIQIVIYIYIYNEKKLNDILQFKKQKQCKTAKILTNSKY